MHGKMKFECQFTEGPYWQLACNDDWHKLNEGSLLG
jgi:hypothetical protein